MQRRPHRHVLVAPQSSDESVDSTGDMECDSLPPPVPLVLDIVNHDECVSAVSAVPVPLQDPEREWSNEGDQ